MRHTPIPRPTTTPTYSADRARLAATQRTKVSSYAEAREAALSWDVANPRSPLRSRVKLDTDDDWAAFLETCCAEAKRDDGSVDLEVVLKKCYEIAFHMPPSPSMMHRSPNLKSTGSGGAESPTPLAI